MEDVEIKEEPALNWWQMGDRGSEIGIMDYAKLWFNDKSFRIRKLESFKTKEEVERNEDRADFDFDYPLLLKRGEILKRFKRGVYDWSGMSIHNQVNEEMRELELIHKYEKIKAFQSGTHETRFLKATHVFDKKKIRMYDKKLNIGYICGGGSYFTNDIPDIEVSILEVGILRRDAIAYLESLKERASGALQEDIIFYLDTVIENLKQVPRLLFFLSDGKFQDQLKSKKVDEFILKNNREPTLKDVLSFPKPSEYLFDFDEDRISTLALRDAQMQAGGTVFLKFYNKGESDVDDMLSKELSEVTKKKNEFELNMLKLQCIAYQQYVNEFLSLAKKFQKDASGKTFLLNKEATCCQRASEARSLDVVKLSARNLSVSYLVGFLNWFIESC